MRLPSLPSFLVTLGVLAGCGSSHGAAGDAARRDAPREARASGPDVAAESLARDAPREARASGPDATAEAPSCVPDNSLSTTTGCSSAAQCCDPNAACWSFGGVGDCCVPTGGSCSGDGDCCSTTCHRADGGSGTCGCSAAAETPGAGGMCFGDTDCCAGSCHDGNCLCAGAGGSCTRDLDCCTGRCIRSACTSMEAGGASDAGRG